MGDRADAGREAFEGRSWRAAYDALGDARSSGPLAPEDLSRLAVSAFLVGDEELFLDALEEAHHRFLEEDEQASAVRSAFWIGLYLAERGDMARATGWFGRAGRALERLDPECPERGYLMLPAGQRQLSTGEYDACVATARAAEALGERFGDEDLLTLATHLRGRALLRAGRVRDGLAALDEAMVSVASGRLAPQVTGLVYCSVIGACREVHALERAQEWTDALTAWCERQPDMMAYNGRCRAYRAEILQREGRWVEAREEVRRVFEESRLGIERGARGAARYVEAEIDRHLGAYAAAEAAFREAAELGYEPQPGLALVRLAQGNATAAEAALRRVLAETSEGFRRARFLPAYVETLLELGRVDDAGAALEELAELAASWESPMLLAAEAYCRGAIAMASGGVKEALAPLRDASRGWEALGAPHAAARARILLGIACRELGDADGAALELGAARATLERLEARPELERLEAAAGRPSSRGAHGLTPREREVLALVATGRTNAAIGAALFISEKTVARHVANIFGKLGVGSRAAATAYAYEHDLLDRST